MSKVGLILRKEWQELRQERALVSTTLLFPLIFTVLPIVLMAVFSRVTDDDITEMQQLMTDPRLAGLSTLELGQVVVGQQFAVLFLMMPLILPTTIAAYSIVGEKTRRTLEPLLATPVSTAELLVSKSLAALIPTMAVTWLCGAIFVGGMRTLTVSDRVFEIIVSPGWLILWLLCGPLMALVAIAASVLISSRVNDPRTAQQTASVIVVPVVALMFGQLVGLVVLSPAFALGAAVVLTLLAAGTLWMAVHLFQREVILTRWS